MTYLYVVLDDRGWKIIVMYAHHSCSAFRQLRAIRIKVREILAIQSHSRRLIDDVNVHVGGSANGIRVKKGPQIVEIRPEVIQVPKPRDEVGQQKCVRQRRSVRISEDGETRCLNKRRVCPYFRCQIQNLFDFSMCKKAEMRNFRYISQIYTKNFVCIACRGLFN